MCKVLYFPNLVYVVLATGLNGIPCQGKGLGQLYKRKGTGLTYSTVVSVLIIHNL